MPDPLAIVRPYRALIDKMTDARAQKDAAYHERDMLVAALSKVYPSHLARHPDSDVTWDPEYLTIVCVHLPTGQATWHVHDSEWHLFVHLTYDTPYCPGWDLHSTDEKYGRLNRLSKDWRTALDDGR